MFFFYSFFNGFDYYLYGASTRIEKRQRNTRRCNS